MIYAPVIIATLNRYEHLKRCIESLNDNPWARFTELFISVDYPPEDKYRSGYVKVIDYLKGNESKWRFKEIRIYIQEKNLGEAKNFRFLRDLAFERFDRVITLEDDAEVSPNFIEFMDKALELAEKEDRIFCVMGFLPKIKVPHKMKGTVFLVSDYGSGCGMYRERREEAEIELSKQWIEDIVNDYKKMTKIFSRSRNVFYMFLTHYLWKNDIFFEEDSNVRLIDIIGAVYQIINDKYAIVPTVSKIRDWGYDGTGKNCNVNKDMSVDKQKIDRDRRFELVIEENEKIKRKVVQRWSRFSMCGRKQAWKMYIYYLYLYFKKKEFGLNI